MTGKTFHYVRVYSAVLDFGRFGETSAEITGIFTTANKATTSVGRTAAPTITVAGDNISTIATPTYKGNTVIYDLGGLFADDEIVVSNTAASSSVYINNVNATTYSVVKNDQIVRVIVQNETAAPYIVIIK